MALKQNMSIVDPASQDVAPASQGAVRSASQSESVFPECVFPEGTPVDVRTFSQAARELLRAIRDPSQLLDPYITIAQVMGLKGVRLPQFGPEVLHFFAELGAFITTPFLSLNRKKGVQAMTTTSFAEMMASASADHIHCGCPYHQEDWLSHLVAAMMASLAEGIEGRLPFDELFRRAVTALLHDIGKPATTVHFKNGNVGFPAHALSGALTLMHCDVRKFSRWFTPEQWGLMCTSVLMHMCGASYPISVEVNSMFATLPLDVRAELYALSRADKGGAFPIKPGNDDFLGTRRDVQEQIGSSDLPAFMDAHALNRVFIRMMGTSAQGKSRLANEIIADLVAKGIDRSRILHVMRDSYIVNAGAKLLGKNPTDTTYEEAYAAVQATKDVRNAINPTMLDDISKHLSLGGIVICDTMVAYYNRASSALFNDVVGRALRIDVHPVRTAPLELSDALRLKQMRTLTQADIDAMSAEMTPAAKAALLVKQITLAADFDIMHPIPSDACGPAGLQHMGAVYEKRDVAHSSINPHFVCVVHTKLQDGQIAVPSQMFTHLMEGMSKLSFPMFEAAGIIAAEPSLQMHLEELLNHLHGQKADIKEWFGKRAFMVSSPFYGQMRRWQFLLAKKQNTADAAASFKGYSVSDDELAALDEATLVVKVRVFESLNANCITIKYLDGVNRQFGCSGLWNIETRNTIAIFDEKTQRWSVTYAMPRGPEVAGDAAHGVSELQDVTVGGDTHHFAQHYVDIMSGMNTSPVGADIKEFIASTKRDGMCVRIPFYPRGTPEFAFWEHALMEVPDSFVKMFVQVSMELSGGRGIFVPASNGTAVVTQQSIQGWIATAIALGAGISYADISSAVAAGATPTDIMLMMNQHDGAQMSVVHWFVAQLVKITMTRDPTCVQMHTFEAVCPDRKSPFDTEPHAELATTYDVSQSGICYLGTAISKEGRMEWLPHYIYEDVPHAFKEPVFWRFSSMLEMRHALADLSEVFKGVLTLDEYFIRYRPANKRTDCFAPDPEGFIAYFRMNVQDGDVTRDTWVYTKAKTWVYYILHKVKASNICQILALPPRMGDVFPGYKQVSAFFGQTERMMGMFTALRGLIVCPNAEFLASIPAKAQGALQKKAELAFKIVLNNISTDLWNKTSFETAKAHFPELAHIKDAEVLGNLGQSLKACLMSVRAYEVGWEARLAEQFDVASINAYGKLSHIPETLWPFFSEH